MRVKIKKLIFRLKVIEFFAGISVVGWILVLILQSRFNFDSTIVLTIGISAFESIVTLIGFVIGSMYFSNRS